MSLKVCTDARNKRRQIPSADPWPDGGTRRHIGAEDRVTSRSFPAERQSVPAVRRYVVSALDEWNLLGVAHVALLLTSELATIALVRARSEFVVTARCWEGRCLRVEVLDGNNRLPRPGVAAAFATTGRGLAVVRALASSWGSENQPDGKVVWFELAVGNA